MVPPYSAQVPRVCAYSGYYRPVSHFAYRSLTFSGGPSHALRLCYSVACVVLTPGAFLLPVWPLSLSLATTREISVDFFSSAYLDVSVRRVPSVYLLFQYTAIRYERMRFPHSDIRGSMLICSSPRLIAACRVLLRLLMPRHSPYALASLNVPLENL